ncbi:TerC family protein [Terrilactibacillus laevilacticus]|uniref:TerC family protein n=1 Tax=Terrilactibacillus laevilacticus TaxID=1380157 RepID=A0ABW5PMQ0_9BACI|nr:TerC family protein [Terrilactibacillus laevilacticus]
MTFLIGLLSIIIIDIVLSGDNAVVIALACRNLPKEKQRPAILLGSGGAILLRIILTFIAFWLLELPLLNMIGGILLLYIAIHLLTSNEDPDLKSSSTLFGAVRTIIIADFVMSLDNVVAIAGAAHGNVFLIIIGLAISMPLIIWGSQLLMKLMERFSIIVTIGAAILGYTAGEMIFKDQLIDQWFQTDLINKGIAVLFALLVVFAGYLINNNKKKNKKQHLNKHQTMSR